MVVQLVKRHNDAFAHYWTKVPLLPAIASTFYCLCPRASLGYTVVTCFPFDVVWTQVCQGGSACPATKSLRKVV